MDGDLLGDGDAVAEMAPAEVRQQYEESSIFALCA